MQLIIRDLIYRSPLNLNNGAVLRGTGDQYGDLYTKWILKIYDEFYITAFIYDIIMEGISGLTYHEFLEDFAAANTSYGTPEHFDPQLLKYLY